MIQFLSPRNIYNISENLHILQPQEKAQDVMKVQGLAFGNHQYMHCSQHTAHRNIAAVDSEKPWWAQSKGTSAVFQNDTVDEKRLIFNLYCEWVHL